MGLKILGMVGTQIFFNCFFFLEQNIILRILKGISPFKMHKIIFYFQNYILFPGKSKKILGFTSKGALAIRHIFSLVNMITKPKFSNCPNVFKIGLFR